MGIISSFTGNLNKVELRANPQAHFVMRSSRIWLLVAGLTLTLASAALGRESVRVATFPSYGKNAGLIWAQRAGLFGSSEIDFDLVDTRLNTIVLTEGGVAQVAQVLCSSVGLTVQTGSSYRVIAIRDQRNPIATVSLKTANIRVPADLAGKRWGYSAGFSPEQFLIEKMGELQGFDAGSIRKMNMDFSVRTAALITGKVDFISGWYGSALPPISRTITDAGLEPSVLRWEDFGADMYGECFIARADYINSHVDVLKKWIAVVRKGFQYVIDNPEEGALSVRDRYGPEAGNDPVLFQTIKSAHDGRIERSVEVHSTWGTFECGCCTTRSKKVTASVWCATATITRVGRARRARAPRPSARSVG